MTEPVLSVRGLSAGYGAIQVLWDLSMDVSPGAISCLIGSNGAGKTTLLRAISGVVKPWSGRVEFCGEDLSQWPAHSIVGTGIAHVPEGRRLFQTMSIKDNLLMGAYSRSDQRRLKQDLDRSYGLFPILGTRRHQAAGTLSGGEQQMCAIARGLMSRPKLLLIDELSLGLAPRVVEELAATLVEVGRSGVSILLVEQDVATALDLAQYGFLLDAGRLVLAGTAAELEAHPTIKLSYIGA